jgi:hypothetical protein
LCALRVLMYCAELCPVIVALSHTLGSLESHIGQTSMYQHARNGAGGLRAQYGTCCENHCKTMTELAKYMSWTACTLLDVADTCMRGNCVFCPPHCPCIMHFMPTAYGSASFFQARSCAHTTSPNYCIDLSFFLGPLQRSMWECSMPAFGKPLIFVSAMC